MPSGPAPDFSALLKGGRGASRDPEQIREKESREERAEKQYLSHVLSSLPMPIQTTTVLGPADRARFNPVLTLTPYDYTVREARICVTTAVAGATIRVALYQLQDPGIASGSMLIQIPSTHVRFDASSTGALIVRLADDVRIPSGTRIFFGSVSSAALVTVIGLDGTTVGMRLINGWALDGVTGDLPAVVSIGGVSSGRAYTSPFIAYISNEMSRVF